MSNERSSDEAVKSLWQLFFIFFKIGAFTFGGGYVMLPIIQHEVTEKYKLLDDDEITKVLILAQSMPGAMAVNASTLIGYKLYGPIGAIVGVLGTVLPSFLIILLLANVILAFSDSIIMNNAFRGIRAVVVGLVLAAAIKMGKSCFKNKKQVVVIIAGFLASVILNVHPVVLIGLGGVLGYFVLSKKKKEGQPIKGEQS